MKILKNEAAQPPTAAARLIAAVEAFGFDSVERAKLQPRDVELLDEIKVASDAFLVEHPHAADVVVLVAEIQSLSRGIAEGRIVNGVKLADAPAIESSDVRNAIASKCNLLVTAVETAAKARAAEREAEEERRRFEEHEFQRANDDKVTAHLISAYLDLTEEVRTGGGDPNTWRELGRVLYARLLHIGVAIPVNELSAIAERLNKKKAA